MNLAKRGFLVPAVFFLIGALPGTGTAANRFVNPDGLCGGNLPCYTTIQDAIDASIPGDVIYVQAGVHSPAAKIDVHTPVTILGAQANINPLPSQATSRIPGSAGESIIDGGGMSGIIVITANDVTLNGLEIRNGSGDLIDSESGIPTQGTIIKHCIIHDSSGDEGIQLRNVDSPRITCNYVYATAGDGINVCCGSVDAQITTNELRNISSPDGGIYLYDQMNATVMGNLIDGTTQNDGIKVGAKNGSDAAKTGGTILNNTVLNPAQDGISVYSSNTVVRCNEISGSTSENGGVYVAHAVSNVSILDNHIHDNGPRAQLSGGGELRGAGAGASHVLGEAQVQARLRRAG